MNASIQTRRDGRGKPYLVRWRTPDGKSRTLSFANKADARSFAATLKADADRGLAVDRNLGSLSLAEWTDRWRATRIAHSPTTVERDETYLRVHILPALGGYPVNAIDRSTLQAFVAELAAKGLAPATVRKAVHIVSSVLALAVGDGALGTNPATRVTLPPTPQADVHVLTDGEVDRLTEAMDPRYRTLVATAVETGLRFGELAALSVRDIDFLSRKLSVDRNLVEVGGRLEVRRPKTQRSVRTIALADVTAQRLAEHLLPYDPDRFRVFPSPQGKPLRRRSWRSRYWLPATEAAGLDGVTFHVLRHTHASKLIKAGVDVETVSRRLGHARTSITLDTYSHLWPGADEAAAAVFDAPTSATGTLGTP